MEQKLQYRVRGGGSPQGKQKVYFCCHPMDFERYFEQISKAIWDTQNCAICFFPEDAEVTEDDRSFELKGMQLFVMPVTTNLLTSDNQALQDFAFAQKEKIPVLPLMQETHLEELYQKKIGNLQFLMKNDGDLTALPYEEKLKKYLASVLVGDELAEKVRKAFDAYIFLSYRKKDRKYAQDLMRLIHKNDFCRDIAIWYDEYLTPGEDFNQAIQDALSRCELFTLVVTPSLLETYVDEHGEEKKNYVMEHEYPMARDTKKPILPTRMQETDGDALSDCYDGIGTATDAHDEAALRELFLAAVKKLAIQENDKDPMHNYFIGLAYLNGIDVEVDRDRAVALITSAAEANLPEAIEKLVSMYNNGEGVERDYEEAIHWQEILVTFYGEEYRQNPTESDCATYANAIWHLGNFYFDQRDLSKATEIYQKLRLVAEETIKKDSFVSNISPFLFKAYIGMGDTSLAAGDVHSARSFFEQGLSLSQKIVANTKTVAAKRDLSLSNERLGKTVQIEIFNRMQEGGATALRYHRLDALKQLDASLRSEKSYFTQSLYILLGIAEESDVRSDLFTIYVRLGEMLTNSQLQATDFYRKAFKVSVDLAEETKSPFARRNLAKGYDLMGSIALSEKNLSQAKEYYGQSFLLRKDLAEETKAIESYDDLATSYYTLGILNGEDICLFREAYHLWSDLAIQCPKCLEFARRRDIAKQKLDI